MGKLDQETKTATIVQLPSDLVPDSYLKMAFKQKVPEARKFEGKVGRRSTKIRRTMLFQLC